MTASKKQKLVMAVLAGSLLSTGVVFAEDNVVAANAGTSLVDMLRDGAETVHKDQAAEKTKETVNTPANRNQSMSVESKVNGIFGILDTMKTIEKDHMKTVMEVTEKNRLENKANKDEIHVVGEALLNTGKYIDQVNAAHEKEIAANKEAIHEVGSMVYEVASVVDTKNAEQDSVMAKNEAAITSNTADIKTLNTALSEVQGTITKNVAAIEAHDASIKEVANKVVDLKKSVDTVNAAQDKVMTEQAAAIAANKAVIHEVGAAVAGVAAAVDTVNAAQDATMATNKSNIQKNVEAIAANTVAIGENAKNTKVLDEKVVQIAAAQAYRDVKQDANVTKQIQSAFEAYANALAGVETTTEEVTEDGSNPYMANFIALAAPVAPVEPAAVAAGKRAAAQTEAKFTEVKAVNDRQDAQISDLYDSVKDTGAASAALAALHPMENGAKSQVMVGAGHYRGQNAMAVGVAYKPNNNVQAQLGSTITGTHKMVNAGITFGIGQGRVAKEENADVQDMKKRIEVLEQQVKELMAQLQAK